MSRSHTRFEDLPDVLTVPQVARFLDVGHRVVYRMIRERRLPAMHFGRIIRISKRAFGAVLERGELNGETGPIDVNVNLNVSGG